MNEPYNNSDEARKPVQSDKPEIVEACFNCLGTQLKPLISGKVQCYSCGANGDPEEFQAPAEHVRIAFKRRRA